MSTRPTIVLIPGSFCFADMYDVVAESLRAKGHEIHVVEPPCYPAGYNRSGPPPSLYADAKYVNDFVTNLANEGKEVVIVAHSYGGVVATESLKGITKKEREQKGEKGGVVRVAYLGAVVPALGESCFQTIGGGAPTPVIPDENGWLTQGDFTALAAYCCSDLPLEEGIVQVSKMGKHFGGCMVEPVTYAGHKDVPVSWFFTAKDKTVLPEVQQKSIDRIESGWVGTEREGKKVDVTRVECDHAPLFLEDKREKLIQWIDEVVEKGGRD